MEAGGGRGEKWKRDILSSRGAFPSLPVASVKWCSSSGGWL